MSEDLRQADLSHLSLKDMTPAQRAEIRRRYEEFARGYMKLPEENKPEPKTRKWVPGMKA